MNKIKTIIRKEWAEVFKNRMVIFTVALPAVTLVPGSRLPCGTSSRFWDLLDHCNWNTPPPSPW